jgi:ABC-type transport system involved in multi-copper enzyme maturation permease subunit
MPIVTNFVFVMLKTVLRDKVLYALLACGLFLLLLVPTFSLFSMRQVQELSITLSLSVVSFLLLVFTLLLGSSSIWGDVEKRYTTSVMGLPISRSSFVLGKFLGIALFLIFSALVLGLVSLVVIKLAAAQYKSDIPILWGNIFTTMAADTCKYILLSAVALLFSALSTSFYFPFFATLSVYLAGSASQEVMEYITGEYGKAMAPFARYVTEGLYYILPNFSAFNLKVYAIYSLPIPYGGILLTFVYFLVYTAILLSLAVRAFARRELP